MCGLLTGLQEALQLHWADELLPVVRPPGNNTEQLLGYDNAQSEGQVGLINSGDEERTTGLRTEDKTSASRSFLLRLTRHHLGRGSIYRTRLRSFKCTETESDGAEQRHFLSGREG